MSTAEDLIQDETGMFIRFAQLKLLTAFINCRAN